MARPRMPGQQQLLVRAPIRQINERAVQEQRARLMMQQQAQQHQQQQRAMLQARNPLDPYDEMVQQRGAAGGPNAQNIRMRPPAPQPDQQVLLNKLFSKKNYRF